MSSDCGELHFLVEIVDRYLITSRDVISCYLELGKILILKIMELFALAGTTKAWFALCTFEVHVDIYKCRQLTPFILFLHAWRIRWVDDESSSFPQQHHLLAVSAKPPIQLPTQNSLTRKVLLRHCVNLSCYLRQSKRAFSSDSHCVSRFCVRCESEHAKLFLHCNAVIVPPAICSGGAVGIIPCGGEPEKFFWVLRYFAGI